MKQFLKLFILLQTTILSFLFLTSVFNIYEKNNIINSNYIAYQLEDNSATNRRKLYDELASNHSSFEVIQNELNSENITYQVFPPPIVDKKSMN